MYLNIGRGIIINSKNIIAILNIEFVKNTKEYKNLYNNLEENNMIEIVEENKKISFILTKEKEKTKAYITNIGVNTIAKRLI